MNNKINLNKLKEEISNRKNGGNVMSSVLGEKVGVGIAPRDSFLNGLLESLKTGRETASSALVKTVDNKVADKKGETTKLKISNSNNVPNQRPIQINDGYDASPERDEQLYIDLEKRRKQTLVESISNYSQTPMVGAPMQQNNHTQMNEGYLVENVKNIVNGYLVENFAPIVEEAIKSTILEMYAVERIKEVLHENKDLIKTVVIEVIKEIQSRNKAKSQ